MADKDKKKKHGKPPWMDDDDEKDESEEDDDEKKSFRGGGMNELEKAGRELQQTLHEEQTGESRKPSLRDAIEGFTSNLARSAKELTDFLGKAEGGADSGNDPEYRMATEYRKLAKRKKGASQNSSDNESYEEQEREQEETIEEAEQEMDGSTLVSGAGKRNADFHDQGGGRRIAIPDHEGSIERSANRQESVDQFYRSLADNDEFVQVLEASPALAHLSDVVAERLADLEERLTSQLKMLGKSMAILMRSQAQFNKSFISAPDGSSRTSPGVFARTTDGKGPEGVFTINGSDPNAIGKSNGTAAGSLRKAEIASKIEAAIGDGKADPMELARFDAAGLNGLGMDEETRKQYGIPLNPRS